MKCYVCGTEIESFECPRCGFIHPRMIGDSGRYEAMLKGLAEEYRKSLQIGTKIGMMQYHYKLTDGRLEESGRTELMLTEDYGTLEKGTIVWNSQAFGRLDEGELIVIFGFTVSGEERKYWQTSFPAPRTEGLWRVGIRAEEGGFRILVGDETRYGESEILSAEI